MATLLSTQTLDGGVLLGFTLAGRFCFDLKSIANGVHPFAVNGLLGSAFEGQTSIRLISSSVDAAPIVGTQNDTAAVVVRVVTPIDAATAHGAIVNILERMKTSIPVLLPGCGNISIVDDQIFLNPDASIGNKPPPNKARPTDWGMVAIWGVVAVVIVAVAFGLREVRETVQAI